MMVMTSKTEFLFMFRMYAFRWYWAILPLHRARDLGSLLICYI